MVSSLVLCCHMSIYVSLRDVNPSLFSCEVYLKKLKVTTPNVQASAELSASNQVTQLDVLVVDFQDLFQVTTLFEIHL